MFACPTPIDLRKGYNARCGVVQSRLKRDLLSGELFLFSLSFCELLLWDRTGWMANRCATARRRFRLATRRPRLLRKTSLYPVLTRDA